MNEQKKTSRGTLLFSSQTATQCPKCQQVFARCQCTKITLDFKGDGKVRVSLETKGRKGKGVSLIEGLPLRHKDLLKIWVLSYLSCKFRV